MSILTPCTLFTISEYHIYVYFEQQLYKILFDYLYDLYDLFKIKINVTCICKMFILYYLNVPGTVKVFDRDGKMNMLQPNSIRGKGRLGRQNINLFSSLRDSIFL